MNNDISGEEISKSPVKGTEGSSVTLLEYLAQKTFCQATTA